MTGPRVADFDFDLPPELIAQQPPASRGESSMLVVDRSPGAFRDAQFAEFPSQLVPGDLLVLTQPGDSGATLARRATKAISPCQRPKMLDAPSLRFVSGARVGTTNLGSFRSATTTGRIEVMLTEPVPHNRWCPQVWGPHRQVLVCGGKSRFWDREKPQTSILHLLERTFGAPWCARQKSSQLESDWSFRTFRRDSP